MTRNALQAPDPFESVKALTGHAPYRWQRRLLTDWLLAGRVPQALDIPTGLGKTTVMALWLVARACRAPLPRRLVYVVDRRAVVDQATEEADKLAEALKNASDERIAALRAGLGLEAGEGLPVSTLRGQHADNRAWLRAPHLPAIVVGTIDMIGSRLLFEGYGVSRRMRPMHAGLLGSDALVVLDEAHLAPPFEALLRGVAAFEAEPPVPAFRMTSLSATGRCVGTDREPSGSLPAGEPRGSRSEAANVFTLADEDIEADEAARKRLTAGKWLTLEKAAKDNLVEAMAARAVELGAGAQRVIVFANSRKTAQAIAASIEKKNGKDGPKPELLVGARRVFEREGLKDDPVFKRFSVEEPPGEGPAFLVATSAGEVGVDLDADALVCDLAPFERMVQRLGRVNRRAEPGVAPVVVFDAIEDDGEDEVEDTADARKENQDARQKIVKAMRELFASGKWPKSADGARDASPRALRRLKDEPELAQLIAEATTPEPLRPQLTPALLDAFAMTSLEAHTGRPLVAPWLRGWVEKEPQSKILWRKTLPPLFGGDRANFKRLNEFFDAAPPHVTEALETYSREIVDLLKKRATALTKGNAAADASSFSKNDLAAVVLSPASEVERYILLRDLAETTLSQIAGRTIVVDARLRGLDGDGLLAPKADTPPKTIEDDGWFPEPGFRVNKGPAGDGGKERNWRVAFRCPATTREDDEDGEEIRVEVLREKRRGGPGDLALSRKAQTLAAHEEAIVGEAERLADKLGLAPDCAAALVAAARLHDRGKARDLWQRAMGAPHDAVCYAKTEGGGNPRMLEIGDDTYRHEFGSLREAQNDADLLDLPEELRDLALHLVAAHHGFARPVIAALDPDELPSISAQRAPAIALRFARLQRRWGWWGLAWWEALLRAADWAASAKNDAGEGSDG